MTTSPTQTDSPAHHDLKCMEVWGGSSKTHHIASVPGLDMSVHAHPIDEHGGDLYLISSCSSGWITRILLADVSGHGQAVSDLATRLRKAMHRSINTVDQSKIARTLNTAFDAFSREGRYATALLMSYFAQTGHLLLVNAGHPPPLMQRAGEDLWFPIVSGSEEVITQTNKDVRAGIKNLPLGVIADTEYEQIAIPMHPGDRVCLYTDAYTESVGSDGRQLGTKGLARLLGRINGSNARIEEFHSRLQEILHEEGIRPADDDFSMVVLERNEQERPPLTIPVVSNWLKSSFGLGHTDTEPG